MCSRTTWSRPRPRPGVFEAKAKATKFCPRAVLEVEASPRGPHPWLREGNKPGPRTYFSRQRMQSTAALAKTPTLSVARNTLNTSNTAATCCCRDSFTSSLVVYSIFTARRAPNNGFQPLRMLDAHASTNSQIEQTT